MSIVEEYKRQFDWRSWQIAFDSLPSLAGKTILDLGCAVGDQAAALVARGAHIIGIDINDDLLKAAESRGLANATFRKADLRKLPDLGKPADGLWCSFTAAYMPDLPVVLESWSRLIRSGGWIAITEIDDLFGHLPVSTKTKSLLEDYVQDSFHAGRYDFRMGRKLSDHLNRAGFQVARVLILDDLEFSFHGPAHSDVLDAWRKRLDRMTLLRDFCGPDFVQVRDEFLDCLRRKDHQSMSRVYFCVGIK